MAKRKKQKTNLDIVPNSIKLYIEKGFESFKIMSNAFKSGTMDFDIYNKTITYIRSNDFNKILEQIKNENDG